MKLGMPVLFLIFNRPDTTEKVFQEIKKAKPERLFIASDGPRISSDGEKELVERTRKLVIDNIDWDCEIRTLFRDDNLGCKMAVSGAISWFFDQVEEGIILEDDCLPNQSFFYFCEELLKKYKYDERVMIISGHNKQGTWNPDKYDYFFSNLGGIWGWASWRRAWKKYDREMAGLQGFIDGNYFEYLFGKKLGNIRKNQMLNSPDSTWDYAWGFSRHMNSGLACVPSKNLVKNIGFGEDSTHTKSCPKNLCTRTYDLELPLRDNDIVVADNKYDRLFFNDIPGFVDFFINKLKK